MQKIQISSSNLTSKQIEKGPYCTISNDPLIGKIHEKCLTERHLQMEEVFRNIEDEKSEEFGLELKIQRVDEACCVVVSEANPRDDNLPVLFLHSSD